MNLHERAACDGLADDDTSIMADMLRLREHCERLVWEIESASRELVEVTAKMRAGGSET